MADNVVAGGFDGLDPDIDCGFILFGCVLEFGSFEVDGVLDGLLTETADVGGRGHGFGIGGFLHGRELIIIECI